MERPRSDQATGRWVRGLFPALLASLLFLAGCAATQHAEEDSHSHDEEGASQPRMLTSGRPVFSHIHGVGFLEGTETVVVAAHDGLWFHAEGKWSHPDLPFHDYMGFAPVRGGFYASGHPDLSTDLPNPLGLVKVTEGGAHLEQVNFAGKLDFHSLAAGYDTRSIYLFNEQSVPELPRGLHYSVDGGASWKRAAGYPGAEEPASLSAHPSRPETVAVLVSEGVLVSSDFGRAFRQIEYDGQPSAVAFHPDGVNLLIGDGSLFTYQLDGGEPRFLASAPSAEQAIEYLAVNHENTRQIVAATQDHAVYVSHDSGDHWNEITGGHGSEAGAAVEEPCDCGAN